jgi:hypothetical protein
MYNSSIFKINVIKDISKLIKGGIFNSVIKEFKDIKN